MIDVRREGEGISFPVVVQPRASRTEVGGERGGALKVRLTAPPAEGAANRQCVELLAKALGVPKGAVEIVSGASSRQKRIRVRHADPPALEAILSSLSAGPS